MKASLVHRVLVSCPICKGEHHRKLQRAPAAPPGNVTTQCVCDRCSARFSYEEDRFGKVKMDFFYRQPYPRVLVKQCQCLFPCVNIFRIGVGHRM